MTLDQEKLQDLYAAPTESFTADMRRLIRELPHQKEERTVRYIPKKLIIAVAIMLALLTTTAFALTRPAVLDWLLGHSPASDALTATVQEVNAEAKADGITLRVTSLVWDGNQFAFSYEAEADDPTHAALVQLDPVFTVNGQEAAFPSYLEPERGWVPSTNLDLAPVKRNPVVGGQWSGKIDGLSGEVACEMTFRIYRPEKGFVFLISENDPLRHIDEMEPDFQADLRDQMACLQSLKNALIPGIDEQDEAYWIEQGYTVTDENLAEPAVVTLSFTFDADKAMTHDFSGAEGTLPDGTALYAAKFVLSPIATQVDVRLIPDENTQEAAQALMARHGAALLTDGSGIPVTYSHMDYEGDGTPYVTCMDGQWVCRYAIELPGLLAFPETVTFRTEAGELLRFDLAD